MAKSDFDRTLGEVQDATQEQKEADSVQAREERLTLRQAELDRKTATVKAEITDLKRLMNERDSVEDMRAIVEGAITPFQPIPFKPLKSDTKKTIHEWVLELSDWHIGQLTTLDETGGLFQTNTPIAIQQIQTLWNALSQILAVESHGIEVETLHILSLGDMVDGDLMRVSQTRKVDKVVAEQYPIVFGLMVGLIKAALTKIKNVNVHVVGGNHDRFGKYGDAGMGELAYIDNWSYILGTALEAAFMDEPRVEVTNHKSFFGTTIVAGHKFAFGHGSDVNWASNSYAGLPYYSLNVAAERMKAMVDGYDVLAMGHGHVAMELPVGFDSRVVMNGSLPGSSTFVQSKYKSVRRPMQTLIQMHERIGFLGKSPIYLDHEGVRTAAEMWEDEPTPTMFEIDLTEGNATDNNG